MRPNTFDDLTKILATSTSHRRAFRRIGSLLAAGTVGGVALAGLRSFLRAKKAYAMNAGSCPSGQTQVAYAQLSYGDGNELLGGSVFLCKNASGEFAAFTYLDEGPSAVQGIVAQFKVNGVQEHNVIQEQNANQIETPFMSVAKGASIQACGGGVDVLALPGPAIGCTAVITV